MSELASHVVLAKGCTKFLRDSNGKIVAQLFLVHENALQQPEHIEAEINKVKQKKHDFHRKHNAAAFGLKQAPKFYVCGASTRAGRRSALPRDQS